MFVKIIRFTLVAAIFFFVNDYVQCGKHSLTVSHGTDVQITDYPYMAHVYSKDTACGGSILSVKFVITAAHCCIDFPEKRYTVRVGSIHREYGGIERAVSGVYKYIWYSRTKCSGDIAILKLSAPLTFSDSIDAIELPRSGMVLNYNVSAIALGYGQTSPYGSYTPQLQQVYLKMIDKHNCENYLGEPMRQYQLCFGDLTGKFDTCPGDGGGPIIYDKKLIGITACSKKPCATPNAPGLYTDVRQFLWFIRWNMCIHA